MFLFSKHWKPFQFSCDHFKNSITKFYVFRISKFVFTRSRKEHFEGSGSTDPTACAHDEIPPTGGGGISSWRDAPAAQPSGASASSSSAPVPARDSNEASSSQATVVPPRNSNRAFLDAIPTSCVPVVIPKAPAQPNPFHGQFARGVAKPKPKGNGGPKAKAHSRAPVNLPKSVPVRVPKAPAASLIMPLNVHLPGSVAAGVVHAPEFLVGENTIA